MHESEIDLSPGRLEIESMPMRYKIVATIPVGLVLLLSMAYLVCFLIKPESYPSPKELSLFSVVTTMAIVLLVVWLPWAKMEL